MLLQQPEDPESGYASADSEILGPPINTRHEFHPGKGPRSILTLETDISFRCTGKNIAQTRKFWVRTAKICKQYPRGRIQIINKDIR